MNNNLLRFAGFAALLTASLPASVLFVADADGHSVSTVTPAGVVTPLVTGLTNPKAIALRSSVLYVADNDQILEFDAISGASLGLFASFAGVDSIVLDLAGNVFAASSSGGEIRKYDSGGTQAATPVTGLDTPGALAIDSLGRLFVTYIDGANGIRGFRYSGADLSALGVFITSGLNTPMAATYQGGTLYISNLFGGVDQVDSSGDLTPFVTSDVNFPWGIAFDNTGDLYVASSLDGSIQHFNGAGVFQNTLANGFVTPSGIAFAEVPEPGTLTTLGAALVLLLSRGASRASNRRE